MSLSRQLGRVIVSPRGRFFPIAHPGGRVLIRPETGGHNLNHTTSTLSIRTYSSSSNIKSVATYKDPTTESSKDASPTTSPPTRAPEGSLSIVFTDIVKSTAMWEKEPEAMSKAMQIHDDTIRALTTTHKGYEVKQNGDGFMIAFQTSLSAMRFSLAVQQQLLNQDWPDDLLQLPSAMEKSSPDVTNSKESEENVLFRGLRLRVSIHWGEPVCTWNEVISRMDYLGPVVNRAARFIQVAEAGQIVVSDEFLQELKAADGTAGDSENAGLEGYWTLDGHQFQARLLGNPTFRGLDEPQKLYLCFPQELKGRLELWPRQHYVPGSKGNILQQAG